MNSKRVLVTGSSGFVGQFVCAELKKRGYEPVGFDLLRGDLLLGTQDIRFLDRFDGFMNGIDGVIHLAGLIDASLSMRYPLVFYDTNVVGTLFLLMSMKQNYVKRLVFASSAAVYEPSLEPRHLIDEDDPKAPTSPYGSTKLIAENMIKEHQEANPSLSYVILRLFNVAGASMDGTMGENHDPETHLIPNIIKAGMEDKPFKLNSVDGLETSLSLRDYVHVKDVARAFVDAYELTERNICTGTYNICSSIGRHPWDVHRLISHIMGKDIPVDCVGNRDDDQGHLVGWNTKAKLDLGWSPQHSFQDILTSAVKWHTKHG